MKTPLEVEAEAVCVYILEENLSMFCPCLEIMLETKIKNGRLINLVAEISFSHIYHKNPR